MLYDLADTAEVMRWYRELLPSLPEELNGWIALLTIPPAPPFPEALWGRKACGIVWCYTGPHDRADEVLEPVKSFGSPLVVGLQPMPFTALQSAFDPLYPAGLQWYWRADFFNEISDAAIEVHVKYGAQLPTGHSTMHLYPIDGAASRVPADATAFAYRDGGYNGIIAGVDPDPANAGRISAMGQGLLGGAAPDLGRRRLRQLPDGRGPGPDQGLLPRQLRPARPGQAPVRPGQPLPRQPEHPAGPPARRLARPRTRETGIHHDHPQALNEERFPARRTRRPRRGRPSPPARQRARAAAGPVPGHALPGPSAWPARGQDSHSDGQPGKRAWFPASGRPSGCCLSRTGRAR